MVSHEAHYDLSIRWLVKMTACDLDRSLLSLLSLLLFQLVNLIGGSSMSSSSSHPPWQLWMMVRMISNIRSRKMKTSIVLISNGRVLLTYDTAELFVWVVGDSVKGSSVWKRKECSIVLVIVHCKVAWDFCLVRMKKECGVMHNMSHCDIIPI